MNDDYGIDDIVDKLDNSGYISLSNGYSTISIQSVDDKEGYSYITDSHRQFTNSRDAVRWAVSKLRGIEHIEENDLT